MSQDTIISQGAKTIDPAIGGVIAALPTPLSADENPDRELFAAHGNWALANGCDGLNILGSTGEANSFDCSTRERVMGWAAAEFGTARLMVGTATPSLAETIRLTSFADELGYPVALVLPPYYYKPLSDEGLYAWYGALDEALGSRRIGVYFYNYPQMTGLKIPEQVIERLWGENPDRFRGIKDSSGDLAYCRYLASHLAGFSVFPSSETSLAEAAESGFAGCISATANHTAPLCAKVWAERVAPDAADLELLGALRSAFQGHPLVPAVKHLVGRRTHTPAWDRVAPPLQQLSPPAKASLEPIFSTFAELWAGRSPALPRTSKTP